MIVFDLRCSDGHVFEAWFGASADYESQRARGLILCPLCGDGGIDKAMMAPRLSLSGAVSEAPVEKPAPNPAEMKTMLAAMATAQAKMLAKSSWVGGRFADEARAMHHGERDQRSIHGQATARQAAALIDEGIGVAPLPFPVTPPEQNN